MTSLLISVINVAEANVAMENGADIIDLKDPVAGALGALPLVQINAIVRALNGQKKISATIGDVPMQADLIVEKVLQLTKLNIDYIKIGFFIAPDYQNCIAALQPFVTQGVKLIAVLFAEYTYPENLIQSIKAAGFFGIMLDTAQKNGLSMFEHLSENKIQAFSNQVLTSNLMLGLAGSLKLEHIARLKLLNPSYIGFRGGVCDENNRTLGLNATKITALCKLL